MATFKSKLVTIASTSVYESLLSQTEMKLRNSDKLSQFEADVPLRNIHVYVYIRKVRGSFHSSPSNAVRLRSNRMRFEDEMYYDKCDLFIFKKYSILKN